MERSDASLLWCRVGVGGWKAVQARGGGWAEGPWKLLIYFNLTPVDGGPADKAP